MKSALPERSLNERELIELLKQAANRGPSSSDSKLGLDDLVEAGRELGIERNVLEKVFEEHLSRRATRSLRPHDTNVELSASDTELTLSVPPAGLRSEHAVLLAFSLFWLAFLAFWTWGALHASLVAAAFSLPFWAVGLALMASSVRRIAGRASLTLTPHGGRLVYLPFGPSVALDPDRLLVRSGAPTSWFSPRGQRPRPAVLLEQGTRTFALLEGFSDAERRWVVAELKRWLGDKSNRSESE